MKDAQSYTSKVCPECPEHNAWLRAESSQGVAYWDALQLIREWTKRSHYAIHDMVAESLGLLRLHRFWNEHNFVFRRDDGLFYHGKGATPAWEDFANDSSGQVLIPLNMAEPILVARGLDTAHGLGFAPHGAGRNFSRTAWLKANQGITPEQDAPGIDVRYFCGVPDLSELPSAYKDAKSVRAQIAQFGLAEVVDTIEPIGNIMAGDWQANSPWRKKKDDKNAATP
jgi:RNA-splicing ligase RtcB